jgi:phosphoribosyl 1,2-cyclic phosphate phosphodiesterase
MKIRYLGTASAEGIPSLFCECSVCVHAREKGGKDIRRRSSVLVDGDTLFDISPDLFSQAVDVAHGLVGLRQIICTRISPETFCAAELFNLSRERSVRQRKLKMQFFLSESAMRVVDGLYGRQTAALNNYIDFTVMQPFKRYEIFNAGIIPLNARTDSFVYIFERDGRRILYGHNSGFFPEETWDFIYNTYFDFVSLDCASITGGSVPGHMCLEDNITVKKRLFQQKNINEKTRFVSSNFSHLAGLTHFEIDERLRIDGFTAAYDGLEITV